jgi:hypothetical protein
MTVEQDTVIFVLFGFIAQMIDGALGMGFGNVDRKIFMRLLIPLVIKELDRNQGSKPRPGLRAKALAIQEEEML